MSNSYHFLTRWRVHGDVDEVFDIVAEAAEYPRWWPSVYLRVSETAPGDEHGIGRCFDFYTKGWLPYTLRWSSRAVELERPRKLVIRAGGDFDGRGAWELRQDGEFVDISFDWQLSAEKPLLRDLSWLLRPVFEANHRWAMARGAESLRLELARRHARSEEERRRIPAPPGPNRTSGLWLGLATAAVVGAAVVAARRRKG
jgi:hypothetical protein